MSGFSDGGGKRVNETVKGIAQGDLNGNEVILFLDCSGGYVHLDM